jgi:protein TonB
LNGSNAPCTAEGNLILTDHGHERLDDVTSPSSRRRTRRLIAIFVVASTAVHATVIGLAPGFTHMSEPPPAILEVTLRDPEPLAMVAPEPELRPKPNPVPKRTKTTIVPRPPAPVLALPERRSEERSFAVPAPKSTEPVPPVPQVPEPGSPVASVTITPPAFNAAYLRNPAPRYPLASRREGEQGTVTLRVLVDRNGLPARVDIQTTSGWPRLDGAALEAVKEWRFRPAQRGTDPVEGSVLVPIVFRLKSVS